MRESGERSAPAYSFLPSVNLHRHGGTHIVTEALRLGGRPGGRSTRRARAVSGKPHEGSRGPYLSASRAKRYAPQRIQWEWWRNTLFANWSLSQSAERTGTRGPGRGVAPPSLPWGAASVPSPSLAVTSAD